MTELLIVVVALAAWIAIGVVTAIVMARRGHDLFPWIAVGIGFGPFAVPYALGRVRREHSGVLVLHDPDAFERPDAGNGAGVNVLVGFDGSPESRSALRAAGHLFGRSARRVTIATVLDYETAYEEVPSGDPERAGAALTAAARELAAATTLPVGTVLLAGEPAATLVTHALAHDVDVVVVGTRGAGRAALTGSVANRLARSTEVPVLLVGGHVRDAATTSPSHGVPSTAGGSPSRS